MIAASLLLMGHMAGEALVPVVIGVVIDRAIETSDATALVRWLAVLVAVFAWLSSCYRFGARASQRNASLAAHELRLLITERALDPRGSAGGESRSGDALSTATADVDNVAELAWIVGVTAAAFAALGVATVALVLVSIPLTIFLLVAVPVVLYVMHVASRPVERRLLAEQNAAAEASALATDLVSGLRVVKGLGAERAASDRYRVTSRDSLGASLRAASGRAWYEAGTVLLPGLFLAIVALVAGWMAADGTIRVGELVAVIGLAQFIQDPFSTLSWMGMHLASARASATRISTILNDPPLLAGDRPVPDPARPGPVRLRQASAPGSHAVDLDVREGELLGVVAVDATDALAVADLVGRTRDPLTGTVTIADLAFPELDPDALRRSIVLADHDAELFSGTIAESIASVAASPTTAAAASRAAAVDELADELRDGMAADVGERGSALSGGQRQRVLLARALATEAPILVLHEPTTAIDSVTETSIAARLREIRTGLTTVLIASSPVLLAACDRVVFLDPGADPADAGTHDELLERNARYRELVLR